MAAQIESVLTIIDISYTILQEKLLLAFSIDERNRYMGVIDYRTAFLCHSKTFGCCGTF